MVLLMNGRVLDVFATGHSWVVQMLYLQLNLLTEVNYCHVGLTFED